MRAIDYLRAFVEAAAKSRPGGVKAIATAAGVSVGYLGDIMTSSERKQPNPTLKVVDQIAAACNVDAAAVFADHAMTRDVIAGAQTGPARADTGEQEDPMSQNRRTRLHAIIAAIPEDALPAALEQASNFLAEAHRLEKEKRRSLQ